MYSNKQNVAFYGFQFYHHGSHSSFLGLKRALQRRVSIIDATPPSTRLQIRKLKRLDFQWRRLSEYLLLPVYQRKDSSVIHYFYPENTLFRGGEWKGKNKLVLTCHQPAQSEPFHNLLREHPGFADGLKKADVILLMASNDLDEYRKLAPQAEVLCIPHGVDTAFFSPVDRTDQTVKRRVITVGNWLRDYSYWSKTVARILEMTKDVEFTVVAGQEAQGIISNEFKGNIPDRIHLLSGISDQQLHAECSQADLLFLPLIDAWANNALLECASMGVPVMATDLPAVHEYLGEENAVCFDHEEPMSTATMMLDLLKDQPRMRLLGERLRNRMVAEFDWSVIANRHLALYDRLLEDA